MSTTKTPKEKSHAGAPRLAPRPTAASAARAARNATNRNLVLPAQRQSPIRSPPSPASSKIKTVVSRSGPKSNSKTDMNTNKNDEIENHGSEFEETTNRESDIFQMSETASVTHEENAEEPMAPSDVEDLRIPQESSVFDLRIYEEPAITDNPILVEFEENTISLEEPPKKLPETPIPSRPQTPKSVSSRPQTPRIASRPSTPAHQTQRHGTPASRPNTPQATTQNTRPKTPSMPIVQRPITPVTSHNRPSMKGEGDLKSLFATKQKQFHRMKKELDLKQQAILEVFDALRALRERMLLEGVPTAGGEGQQELVVFNVADWAPEEVTQLCRDALASSDTDGAVELFNTTVPIDECALADVESTMLNIPTCFADLCLKAFTERQDLIDWMKEMLEKNEVNGGNEAMERIARYSSQGLELCQCLRELKARADATVDTLTLLSKRACRERATLIAVGESLVREVARLRQDLEVRAAIVNEMREIRAETETMKALEEARRELEEERSSKMAMKDKLSNTETQLRQTRMRVSKMDRQLREAEASISSLTGTVKSLEDQSRQREVQLEARARKLKESLKTGEVASHHLAQKRDSLQTEVNELKEQIQAMIAQHKSEIQDLNNKLKEMNSALEQERKITQREIEDKLKLETALKESQNCIEELKAKVTELEYSKPNPDLPTEREMDLLAELQATKDTLRVTEQEVNICKREKVRFLESLTKIAESDNKIGMQQKLAAELLNKEEMVGKMQTQIRELTKNINLNEQKVIQYEQYVRDLQAHNRAVANCQEAPNGISYQDLQQEIMNLRMSLLDSVHRNEQLSEMLAQKEQQLEQQDKTSRAQARTIKVREDLINMLKNKETEQSCELAALQQDLEHRMKIVDEVNKQIASKADEIQELFATLENKQQQIHRLEKIVLALEEQQRRAQVQRTRHEEKIAALEHELAAGGNRRERVYFPFGSIVTKSESDDEDPGEIEGNSFSSKNNW